MARILIIDDDAQVLSTLKRMLERQGHEVIDARNGRIGIELYRQAPTDLIITDIFMPEKEGLETIIELRRDFPDVKIIATSGGGAKIGADDALRMAQGLGASLTIPKPLENRKIVEAVREALGET